jgi:hypothetical protein
MKYFIYGILAVIFILVVAGFFIINSPSTERALRFDETRVSDLQNTQYQVIYYWQAKQKLPSALSDLVDSTRGVSVPIDPENRSAYGYNIKGPLEFSLCANFSKASSDQSAQYAQPKILQTVPAGAPYPAESNWSHGAGNVCFDRKIDTAFYKPIK